MGTGGGAAAARAWRAMWALALIGGAAGGCSETMPAVLTSSRAYEPAPRMKAMPVRCTRSTPPRPTQTLTWKPHHPSRRWCTACAD